MDQKKGSIPTVFTPQESHFDRGTRARCSVVKCMMFRCRQTRSGARSSWVGDAQYSAQVNLLPRCSSRISTRFSLRKNFKESTCHASSKQSNNRYFSTTLESIVKILVQPTNLTANLFKHSDWYFDYAKFFTRNRNVIYSQCT
jgi:hypothetical protein